MIRGWRLFILIPALAWALALGVGLLAKLRLIPRGGGDDWAGVVLLLGLPTLAGGLYGWQLGPRGESRWLRAIFGSWPSLLVMVLVLFGFSGGATVLFFFAGVFLFGVASLAGVVVHAVRLLRFKQTQAATAAAPQ